MLHLTGDVVVDERFQPKSRHGWVAIGTSGSVVEGRPYPFEGKVEACQGIKLGKPFQPMDAAVQRAAVIEHYRSQPHLRDVKRDRPRESTCKRREWREERHQRAV
jgi:hypothetical protein